jgi:hypothetical protein
MDETELSVAASAMLDAEIAAGRSTLTFSDCIVLARLALQAVDQLREMRRDGTVPLRKSP